MQNGTMGNQGEADQSELSEVKETVLGGGQRGGSERGED